MSNHRVETVHIRLSEDVPELDPNSGIDNTELAWVDSAGIDANSSGAQPLSDFYVADYPDWQEEKWFPAVEGLQSVQKLIGYYRRIVANREDPMGRTLDVIESKLAVLSNVEQVLKIAADGDIYFCLAVRQ